MRSRDRSTGADRGVSARVTVFLKAAARSRVVLGEPQRGVLLDLVVFLVNLAVMPRLTNPAGELVRRFSEGDRPASLAVGTCFLGMFVLPPTAAVLKRWHFHQRRGKKRSAVRLDPLVGGPLGCLSLLYVVSFFFVQSLVTGAGAITFLGSLIFGDREGPAAVFIALVVLTLAAAIAGLVLIFRYFAPPKKAPGDFLRSRESEWLGDACIFANMMLFQVLWNLIVVHLPTVPGGGLSALLGNLFFGGFLTLIVYLPPRIFYLAEDVGRPVTWLSVVLANVPTAVRVFLGAGESLGLRP